MNWKEFFRPTKWKIITTLFIFIVIYFVPSIPCYTGLTTGQPGVPKEVGAWEMCSFGLSKLGNYYDYFGLNNSQILVYIYLVLIAYIVSCAILYFLYSGRVSRQI